MDALDICRQHGRQDVAQMLTTASEPLPSPMEMAERFKVVADLRERLSGHFEPDQVERFATCWLAGGSVGLAGEIIEVMAGGQLRRH